MLTVCPLPVTPGLGAGTRGVSLRLRRRVASAPSVRNPLTPFLHTSQKIVITRILLSSQAQTDRSSLLPIMQDRVLGITEGGRNRFATLLWYLAEPESG